MAKEKGRTSLPALNFHKTTEQIVTSSVLPSQVQDWRPSPSGDGEHAFEGAIKAAARGWSVFPLKPGSKAPAIKDWQKVSSNNREQIKAWAAKFPGCNFGLDCGKSGLVVIDVDKKNGVDGFDSLSAIELLDGLSLPDTMSVSTASGGQHFYFRTPEGMEFASVAGLKLAADYETPGIDVRASGGYVVASGSTFEGRQYGDLEGDALEVMPDRIAEKLKPKKVEESASERPAPTAETSEGGLGFLGELAKKMRETLEGTRNSKLNQLAYRAGEESGWRGVAREDAERELVVAAMASGLGEVEARKTFASGWGAGSANTKTLEEIFPDLPKESLPPRRGLNLIPLKDLLAAPTPSRWLVKDMIEEGVLACLFGESGSMKTFCALDIALSVASGQAWHGRPVKNPGAVVYIAGEGHVGLRKRLRAWMTTQKAADEESIPFYVSDKSVGFLDSPAMAEAKKALDEIAVEHGEMKLIVLDTLARCFGGGDENSTADMSRFIAAMDDLRTRYNCNVLLVHHVGHEKSQRARGSSVLRAALDAEFRLEVDGSGKRILHCTKAKDHEPFRPMYFEPEQVDLGWIDPDTGEPIRSCVLKLASCERRSPQIKKLPDAQQILFDVLREFEEPVTADAWREQAISRGLSPGASPDSKKKTFKRAASALARQGLVVFDGDKYEVPFPLDIGHAPGHAPGHVQGMSAVHKAGQTGHPPLRGVLSVRIAVRLRGCKNVQNIPGKC